MDDQEFSALQLKMAITPGQARWPEPKYTHWEKLHAVPTEARERVRKAYTRMNEIDRNAELSRDGKYRQRREAAAQAIAAFAASKTLARAREAVRYVMEKWERDEVSPEIAEARAATLKAMKEAEQGWQRAIDKIAERASLTKNSNLRW